MLTLTTEAADAIEHILEAPGVPEGAGIRIVSVPPSADAAPEPSTNSGSPSAGHALELTIAEGPETGDAVINDAGARVFLEDAAAELLDDKRLDAEVVEDRVHFSLGDSS